MKQYHNILFVSNGIGEDTDALSHALGLAADNHANLDILITCPPFPSSLDDYKSSYETFLIEKMQQTIHAAKTALSLNDKKESIQIDIDSGNTPYIRIIQRVLRNSYDLVVKAAEKHGENKGFMALDMVLLRQCPCALYLHHSTIPDKTIQIAVAIDPRDEEDEGHSLAIQLLKVSHALAKHYKTRLHVISCWEVVLESYLRQSVLIDIPHADLDEMVMKENSAHLSALHALMHEAGIKDKLTIHHLKGSPAELIPQSIHENKIDILVMGTVARTGISGFIIGNTAENILQKIHCSLWALKPQGFISPVKAF